jgi:glycosyltransferase involved in cell wall biosynthesis
MRSTTIAVVTALSPSSTTLAEYGLHLLEALGRKPGVRIVALVEDGGFDYPELPGVEIVPAWRFDSVRNPVRLARAARRVGADVVLFNAHFTSFGSRKVAAALGLMTPLTVRAAGPRTMTLLHNIVETVDLAAAGFTAGALMRRVMLAIGTVLTWLLVRGSDVVATTMPRYVEILRSKYRAEHIVLTPHGSFEIPESPRPAPTRRRVMTFGKFGTYKRIEPVIEAIRMLNRSEVQLVVAGTDSPNTPGYLADVATRLGGPDVVFTGYVREEDVEATFRDATVTVFPYTATTGSSGVLHQAGSFGCPPVLPRLGDLEDLIEEEGYTGEFFDPTDPADLARAIALMLDDPERCRRIAETNYSAACGLSIDDVVDWHLVHVGRLVHGEGRALLANHQQEVCT